MKKLESSSNMPNRLVLVVSQFYALPVKKHQEENEAPYREIMTISNWVYFTYCCFFTVRVPAWS